MLDISKLERRWLKYKIKNILPYLLIFIIIGIIGVVVPFFFPKKSPSTAAITSKKAPVQVKTPISPATKNNDEAMVLEPSMHFMQSMDAQSNPVTNTASIAPSSIKPVPIQKNLSATVASLPPIGPSVVPPPAIKVPQPSVVKGKLTSIKRDDAAFDIHEVENRFKENSNPNLGVYLAKYHYDHGNYSEAYNYALKTNSINNNIEDSWLIFSKSLVKLGKEEQAKKTLQLYISNSNSQNAKNYLDSLNKENSK